MADGRSGGAGLLDLAGGARRLALGQRVDQLHAVGHLAPDGVLAVEEARVVEEVALRKEQTSRDEVVRDTVRKTEVEVVDERTEADRLSGNGVVGNGLTDRDGNKL